MTHSADRWKELSELYAAALARPDAEREAFVSNACGGDEELRQQLASLLAHHDEAQQTLQSSAAEVLAASMADDIESLVGRRLGAYRIDAPLGSGGMGEVYRATDTRLHRSVAIKILPATVRDDGTLRQRFEREAQAIAALRHPHVCVLHDIGHAGGIDFLVMELLEGDSLAERLRRGPLPIDEALRYAIEIADALGAIHHHGIVHRDLKPGNVMLTESGTKLLDFGLARMRGVPGEMALEISPSSAVPAMGSSTAAGTLPYMTPEQLDRKEVDHRSDIFAFGTLLYEMVTGRKAFDGTDRREIAAAIREGEPPPLPAAATAKTRGLAAVIGTCLRKDPGERWSDAAAMRDALRSISSVPDATAGGAGRARLAVAGALLLALLAATVWLIRRPDTPPADVAAAIPLTVGSTRPLVATEQFEMDPAWSPRGDVLAYAAGRGTDFRIVLRELQSDRPLPGPPVSGSGQLQPRWSPDGSRLLYITTDGVYVWSPGDATSRLVASPSDVPGSFSAFIGPPIITGAAWSPDGREVAIAWGGALHAIELESGRRRHLATTPEELHWCDWSARGTWIACTAGNHHLPFFGTYFGNIAPSAIVVIPGAGGTVVEVAPKTDMNNSPVWSADERRLYFVSSREGANDIYSVEIDDRGAPSSEPVRITTGLSAYSIAINSASRRLAYTALIAVGNLWSLPIPARGERADPASARQLTFGNQVIEAIHVTPDGQWIVYDSDRPGNSEIYRMPIGGGEPERLTDHPGGNFGPEVSADGQWLAYFSWRTESRDIFVQPFDGGPAEQVTATDGHESYPKWLPDGSLLFADQVVENGTLRGLFITKRGEDGRWRPPERLVQGAFGADVLPDGRIIYNRSGDIEMVRPGEQPVALYRPREANTPFPGFLTVGEDGRTYYTKHFDAMGRAVLFSLPLRGGPPTMLARFDDLARPSNRFDFAVGGGRFFFTIEDRRSNVWIADIMER
jgi:Tol biopolymer transport system component